MTEDLKMIDLQLENSNEALSLFGTEDRHLKQLEEQLQVSITSRGEQISVSGSDVDVTVIQEVLHGLLTVIRKGITITERDVIYAIDLSKRGGKINHLEALFEDEITKKRER
ncbi:phosphate starvation-inducible protein PhoH [Gracilibacillus boraciitolerans JCM 21714]|uniref:Phosphate starvation-inducible protein PhoH n=1 Tax=Gracilibacillus boraciitolerans JCM 21714 TaxID=1298598 RepID=W4VD78_9BACI|nr:phosphate starvation-inducible protein PhoH [Gracilibacillus boraciitolerans JCM 21714]